jgi:transposase
MRFYTQQHPFYGGIDWHARTMYLCILNRDGEILVHRNMPAGPKPFLKAIAPYRKDLVVCVACLFTWYWLADLCAREGIACVLGHAWYMKAIHGGKAKHDTIDAQKIAVLLRGGMLPQASVYPAAMRPTRDRLRRRLSRVRKRAERLTPVQQTTSQYNLPALGKNIAYQANRAGVAERFPDPAVQKSIEVDLTLIEPDDRLLRDLALAMVQTAKPHDPQTLYRLQAVPGVGKSLRLVLLYERHTIDRFPRVQDFVSYGRLVKCAKASAGQRSGTSGTKRGNAYLKWAFSEAAVLVLRSNPEGQRYLARLENKHGKGKALTVLAHKLARAVYDRLRRAMVFDLRTFRHSSWSGVGEPVASLDHHGPSLQQCSARPASLNASEPIGTCARTLGLCLDAHAGSCRGGAGRIGLLCAAPPPNLSLTGTRPCRVAMPLYRTV